jgi:hypothetical protein
MSNCTILQFLKQHNTEPTIERNKINCTWERQIENHRIRFQTQVVGGRAAKKLKRVKVDKNTNKRSFCSWFSCRIVDVDD